MKLVINLPNGALRRARSAGALVGALALAYYVGVARADGIPTGDALFYSGTLEDNGVPVEGTRAVDIELFDSASGGASQCTTSVDPVTFTGGAFRVPLSSTCVAAVHANPNLYTEVSVDGTVLPRTKLGAVPYALEAERATSSAAAENADQLDGVDSTGFATSAHTHDTAALTSGTLPIVRGGLGINTLTGNANRLLGANSSASGLELKAINGTSGQIGVTHSAGAITLALGTGVPHGCSYHYSSTATSTSSIVTCPAGKLVVGGGGACAPSDDQGDATENRMKYTRPESSSRTAWETVCTAATKTTWSYAICCTE